VLPPRTESATDSSWPQPLLACTLGLLVVVGTFVYFARRIDAERRDFVESRLRATSDLLSNSARDIFAGRSPRDGLTARMHDLSLATDVRITLVLPDGEVLAESEVRTKMPNLADRAEVREAQLQGHATASRKSSMTGKETLYLALGIEENGAHLGTLRVATDSNEVRDVLGYLEYELTAMVAAALAFGAWIGSRFLKRSSALGSVGDSIAKPEPVRRAA